jgi:methyl acetate hydrolase
MLSPAIDSVLDDLVRGGLVPGVVASVFSRDEGLYFGTAGTHGGAQARALEVDSVFRIASMTKLVTSVAVLILVDEGRVALDSPLAQYIPGFRQPEVLASFDPATGAYDTRPARRDATLRELLSHTGGYGYWFLDEPLRAASGSTPDLFDPPFLMHEPGTQFAYSSSHDIAGLVIEAVTGVSLPRFFDERIFQRLGMGDTGFEPPAVTERLVPIARRATEGFEFEPNEVHGHSPRGGGGLYSTAIDYSHFLMCLSNGGNPLLRAHTTAELMRNQIGDLTAMRQTTALPSRTNDFIFMDGTQKFGLGVMIETRDQPGRRARGSLGWAGIFNTYFWLDPRTGIGAVILMQLQPFADPGCVEACERFEAAVYASL